MLSVEQIDLWVQAGLLILVLALASYLVLVLRRSDKDLLRARLFMQLEEITTLFVGLAVAFAVLAGEAVLRLVQGTVSPEVSLGLGSVAFAAILVSYGVFLVRFTRKESPLASRP